MLSKPPQNRPWKHLLFITFQIIAVSISNGSQMKTQIMLFIDNRGFPGGPIAWFNSNYTETPAGIDDLFAALSFWMQDAFLVSTMWSFWIYITILADVSLLHHLRIKYLLPYFSWYSVFSIRLCIFLFYSKSRHWIDSLSIFSFFYFNLMSKLLFLFFEAKFYLRRNEEFKFWINAH